MLKHSDDSPSAERPEISRLLQRLASESRAWAEAEARLARLELSGLKAQLTKLAIMAALGIAAALCMFLALTQAMIGAVAQLSGNVVIAALAVAFVFALLAVLCALGARRFMVWRTESIFFRWLGSRSADGGGP